MPRLNDQQLINARSMAGSAAAIGRSAAEFRSTLTKALQKTDARHGLNFEMSESRTKAAFDFRLGTAHGDVEALFDHVTRAGVLLGRYRFFNVTKDATGSETATELWAIVIDAHSQASWTLDGGFDWYFGENDPASEGAIGMFLLTLLAKMQEKLAKV